MPADRLREKFFEVWEVDLRQILTDLLKIETRNVSEELANHLDDVAPTKGCRSLVKPCAKAIAGKSLCPQKQFIENRVSSHSDDQLGNILLLLHYRGESGLNSLQLLIKQIPNTR